MMDTDLSFVQSLARFKCDSVGISSIPFSVGEKLSSWHWSPKQTQFGGMLVTGHGYRDDKR
jgi:hypothetical protein